MKKYRFLSWGLGVQSTYILVMAGLGKIEPIDAAIVADTQWESAETMRSFEFYKAWAEQHGIHVEVVTAGSVREDGVTDHKNIPLYTSDGGPLTRQCTSYFKIFPVRRAMRRLAGYHESKPPHPKPGQFENILGISWDEWHRMSTSSVKFIKNVYPLIDMQLNRWDCERGYTELGLPLPGKSACIGCPYRDASSWLRMKQESPQEFTDAVEFDRSIRKNPLTKSTAESLYLWPGLIPLDKVDFEKEAKKQKTGTNVPLFVCSGGVCWT